MRKSFNTKNTRPISHPPNQKQKSYEDGTLFVIDKANFNFSRAQCRIIECPLPTKDDGRILLLLSFLFLKAPLRRD